MGFQPSFVLCWLWFCEVAPASLHRAGQTEKAQGGAHADVSREDAVGMPPQVAGPLPDRGISPDPFSRWRELGRISSIPAMLVKYRTYTFNIYAPARHGSRWHFVIWSPSNAPPIVMPGRPTWDQSIKDAQIAVDHILDGGSRPEL